MRALDFLEASPLSRMCLGRGEACSILVELPNNMATVFEKMRQAISSATPPRNTTASAYWPSAVRDNFTTSKMGDVTHILANSELAAATLRDGHTPADLSKELFDGVCAL